MKLRYTWHAVDDLDMAFSWYEKQRPGLGQDFLDCVEAGLQSILNNPQLYAVQYTCFRRCVIRRFPFSLFYEIEEKQIVIHAVFDNRQNPENKP